MDKAVENLQNTFKFAAGIRPKVGGFPYLAEALRGAGVKKNIWYLPSCQSVYSTDLGPVIIQGAPLIAGAVVIPKFNKDGLIYALRRDQEGRGTFPEFLQSAWEAGVISYEVDFEERKVIYLGHGKEDIYAEDYPQVFVKRP